MSYYAPPYDYFPGHPRYSPADLHPHEMRDPYHPHDVHPADIPHPDDAWGYGPPPPAPPMYPPPHHPTPPPHFPPYEPFEAPHHPPYEPYEAPRPAPVPPERERPPTSNLGNSFAIPKGTRNAMHRAVPAATERGNNIVLAGGKNRPNTASKPFAQSVGATRAATVSSKLGGMAASVEDRKVIVKSEKPPLANGKPSTSPKRQTPNSTAKASSSPSPVPTAGTLVAPPAWKRQFEAARIRSHGETGVAAPVVELASQMLNKRCMQVVEGDAAKRKFIIVIDSTILRRGVLSSRSNEGMTIALYLFQPGRSAGGELVTTETMLCRMKIYVDDTRLLPASGMTNGVQINLLPALTPEKFEKKCVIISIETRPEDFAHGLAMVCLRRIEAQMCASRPTAVPSLLRRHSCPTRPAYPLIAPAAAPSTKRSSSAVSASPSRTSVSSCGREQSVTKEAVAKRRSEEVDEDGEVEVGDQIVSLICPIALRRIGLPGKGRDCKHVQCFDLETYAKLSRLSPKWKCGICNEIIKKTDLTVSEPFLHLLAAYPDAERCIVRSNGSHGQYVEAVMQKKKKVKTGAGKKVEAAIEIVDLSDDIMVSDSTQTAQAAQGACTKDSSSQLQIQRQGADAGALLSPSHQHYSPESTDQMYWVDRRGNTEIATAAESHTSNDDIISRMSPEERAALIQRIFEEAADTVSTNQQRPRLSTPSSYRAVGGLCAASPRPFPPQ